MSRRTCQGGTCTQLFNDTLTTKHRCKKNVEIKIKNVKKRNKRDKNKKTRVNVE